MTPPNGVILDPFAGSCSTAAAAIPEGLSVVSIEKEAEYIPIGEARIADALATVEQAQAELTKPKQLELIGVV